MATERYDPWQDLEELMRGTVFQPVRAPRERPEIGIRLDAAEDGDAYRITAEMPGVRKEDIKVAVEGDSVSITAEVRQEKLAQEGERMVRRERYFGQLSRSFTLPQPVDESAAQASYADGVLKLTLPKRDASRFKRIIVT
jgi:HSP20 family protein